MSKTSNFRITDLSLQKNLVHWFNPSTYTQIVNGPNLKSILDRLYTKTDLVFGFTRAGWKTNLGEGVPGQKTPRTLLAPLISYFTRKPL
ncbi:MAG: hypothetical protein D8M57_17020 [Candidatus Scalindua sp. AMX11]|nr:MAG: hypothetical protein D8M57_17020 [Candidatus Scalindua sp. AMX11]